MNVRYLGRRALLGSAVLALGGLLMAAPATTKTAQSKNETREAAQLLRDIRMDANQVRTHAWRFERLSTRSSVQWQAYDKQWNEIKPVVEDMSIKVSRLESMQPNLAPWEQKAIQNAKTLVSQIQDHTHNLRTVLDQQGAGLNKPELKAHSIALAKDARELAMTAKAPTNRNS